MPVYAAVTAARTTTFRPCGRRCGSEHRGGRVAGVGGGLLHAGDVGGDLLGALRGLLDVAGDFLGGRTLLLDRGWDRDADLVDLGDPLDHVLDRRHRLVTGALDRGDLFGDFGGGLGGLAG